MHTFQLFKVALFKLGFDRIFSNSFICPNLYFFLNPRLAQYWHDPLHGDLHQRESQYIGPINNDIREGYPRNESYKENLQKLNKFVMVKGLRARSNLKINL